MIEIDDVLILLIGIIILIFILVNYSVLKSIPDSKIIIMGFSLLAICWFFSLIEGVIFEEVMNFLQHLFLVFNTVLVAFWVWKKYKRGEEVKSRQNG